MPDSYADSRRNIVILVSRLDAYERLIGDAMEGDPTLFARQDAVEAAWAIVNPVLDQASPLFAYECGSVGPAEAKSLVGGGWA